MTKRSLGRGLGSLIPENNKKNKAIVRIPMEKIYPRNDQPRKNFDEKTIEGLSQSIEKYGLLNPIVLRKNGIRYEIIAYALSSICFDLVLLLMSIHSL